MPPPQLFINITLPPGQLPTVNRTFEVVGNISWLFAPANWSLRSSSVSVQFGPGGSSGAATFTDQVNWRCTGTVSPFTPWGSMVQLTIHAQAVFRIVIPFGSNTATLNQSTTFMVRLFPPVAPSISLAPFASPIVAQELPLRFAFVGSATSPQAPVQLVQYKVEGGEFANATNLSGNWSQFQIILPLPPTTPGHDHTLTIRAIDTFGTTGEISVPLVVQPDPPIVMPPGSRTTFSGAPTTSSITSWTRLEPESTDANIGTSSSARVFDPLWMLTRQWQMGEFQGEDAGTPIQARVRATSAILTRRFLGEAPRPTGAGPVTVSAQAYDPSRTPLEVLVERQRMRAADETDARMLPFAVEAGLHFLRLLDLAKPSKSYRPAFVAKFGLQPIATDSPLVDDATVRYLQSMTGRALDGRRLASVVRRVGATRLAADPDLGIADDDRAEVQVTAATWLDWYETMCSEPAGPADDAWNPPRLEYVLSVGTRLSADARDEMTFSATEIDGPIDWSSFDVDTGLSLTPASDQKITPLVEAVIPAPVSFPGSPAPRFWEMEDARIAYGLVPVGPSDLAHLLMIEYASAYGNDWFVLPLTLPVGSVTRVDSLVVTDTFGVRSLVRPLNDPALPPAFFSMWQPSLKHPILASGVRVASNRFFLPPTLSRTLDSAPLEDVLFMRDEMANLAWAIERTVESPIEQPAQRYDGREPTPPSLESIGTGLPRYLLASEVPRNWIPLLPVQVPNPVHPNTPGQSLSRLKRAALLQPDGMATTIQSEAGEVLRSVANLLLYDEEVPREGARITRQRRLARWSDGSTWLWTGFRSQVGQGEGSSALRFDQLIEPPASTSS
jgi:hypothetical protein